MNKKYYYISDNTSNTTYYGVQISKESLYNLIDNMTNLDELMNLQKHTHNHILNICKKRLL